MISATLIILGLFLVIILLLAYIAWQEFLHNQERRDLYSRIMAGSLGEYREAIEEKKPPPKGGNMVRAGLRKAARNDGLKVGDT